MAPKAACQPATRLVKKKMVARTKELISADFQFHLDTK